MSSSPDMAAAIAKNFDGNRALYDAFAQSCAAQFATDTSVGQMACETGDLARLRRLAHDLASVLLILGHTELGELAACVERTAAAGDLPAASGHWRTLRGALLHQADS